MLKQRILATLRFFDLQEYPLTLLELHKFLIANVDNLKLHIDAQGETKELVLTQEDIITIDQVLYCVEQECGGVVENYLGFYCLPGRKSIIDQRLANYFYGISREKNIRRFVKYLNFIPFVRGVALGGSQAMGLQKEGSDIDLLIITDPQYIWLTRTLVTAFFQLLGKRRYGIHIKNRFCLNHYLAGPKKLSDFKNLYTAYEYLRLRTLVGPHSVWQFKKANENWLRFFFPNNVLLEPDNINQNQFQNIFETLLNNNFGLALERFLKTWQLPKIKQEKFIVVEEDELSFHPESKQQALLSSFFKV